MSDQNHTPIFFLAKPRMALASFFTSQGQNKLPLQWKHEVLTTGPPGQFPHPSLKPMKKKQ